MRQGYPSDAEKAYTFQPRPIAPNPPVSPEEFKHRFYEHSWHRRLSRTTSSRHREGLRRAKKEIVCQLIPKRDSPIDEEDDQREVFWGLYAVRIRSALVAFVYSVLFLLPSILFFFAWMFSWGHAGDLQNASVPLMFSASCLAIFWGMVFMTSSGFQKKEKGD